MSQQLVSLSWPFTRKFHCFLSFRRQSCEVTPVTTLVAASLSLAGASLLTLGKAAREPTKTYASPAVVSQQYFGQLRGLMEECRT